MTHMTQKLYKPVLSASKAEDESLFSGIWLRWRALNTAECFICTNIILLPIWWFVGLLDYMPLLILVGIVLYEWRRYGKLRLKRPSLLVVVLFTFFAYYFVDAFLIFFNSHPTVELLPGDARSITLNYLVKSAFEFSLPCLVWYIQSNNVRVRLEAVVWACSVSVAQMLVFWLVVQFLFPGSFDHPPRSLYGILTGKSEDYVDGLGINNYLLFYDEDGRFSFFFGNKQPCAAFLGLIALLTFDIKNRLWSLLLLGACIFLMSLTATRSVGVALPAMLFVRFLFTTGKFGGAWLVFALVAIVSFASLSLSPVTDLVFNLYTGTTTAVHDARPGSSEIRSDIYTQTLEGIPDKLLFGHKIEGPHVSTTVGQGEGPRIGSHSFILGELLYKGGLVATGIFATFWALLIIWFYNTRFGRPVGWFSVLLLFSLISSVSFFHSGLTMGTLLCMVIRKPAIKSFNRNTS